MWHCQERQSRNTYSSSHPKSTPTVSCPAHRQGDTLATYPILSVPPCQASDLGVHWAAPRRAVLGKEGSCQAIKRGSESLGNLLRSPDTPPKSYSQISSLTTLSELLLRCPAMDLNHMLPHSKHHLSFLPQQPRVCLLLLCTLIPHMHNFNPFMVPIQLYYKFVY